MRLILAMTFYRWPIPPSAITALYVPSWLTAVISRQRRIVSVINPGNGAGRVKAKKRPPEYDREFEELPSKAGGLLMLLLLAQGPRVLPTAMFE